MLAVIKYRRGSISIEKREWDLQTVTASDYTIEIKIYAEQYEAMKREINRTSFMRQEADGLRVKLFLQKLVEDRTNEISGGQGGKVADINFAYKNMYLLDSLVTRGDYIKYKQWDELNKLNKEMTIELHKNMEEYITPVCAFISMESEEAYNHIVQSGKFNILGKESTIKEAVEPTNVIWENRDMRKDVRAARMFLVVISVVSVLVITFFITTYAKNVTNETIGKYDDSIKCKELAKIYTGDTLQKLAADDWIDFYINGGDDLDMLIPPTLSCFCEAEYARMGNDVATTLYASSSGKKVQTCSEIFEDRALVGIIASCVSFMIVLVNFVLKVMLVELIKSLRLKTVTLQTNYTMISVFVGQFANTAILQIMNNASLADFDGGTGILAILFPVGTMTDFNVDWYKSVGTLLMKAMLMAAIWPLIEFVMFASLIAFTRWTDRGFGSDSKYTTSPSVQAYIDTWAGPEYLIHYRYATILL
jgi:hypothetical protein